jgi:hypothetical protein
MLVYIILNIGGTITMIYFILFFIVFLTTITIRMAHISQLYSIKRGNLFDKSADEEMIGFLSAIMLPMEIKENFEEARQIK